VFSGHGDRAENQAVARELLTYAYAPYSVRDRDAIVFEGEQEKIRTYRKQLAVS
jgi:hypothetical protein